jgi:hypothetical protein
MKTDGKSGGSVAKRHADRSEHRYNNANPISYNVENRTNLCTILLFIYLTVVSSLSSP